MTQQTIADNDAWIQTLQVASSTGPFTVDFPFFGLDDVIVTLTDSNGDVTTLTRGADYTLTATAGDDGSYPSGSVTLAVAVVNTTVTRYRRTPIERLSNFPLTGYLDRLSLNADLNRLTASLQDFQRAAYLALRYQEENASLATAVYLPSIVDLKGKLLAFDATTGAPIASNFTLAEMESQPVPWIIKTTTYSANIHERIAANTTSAAFTVTLPAAPSDGQSVWFDDPLGTWGTNNLTIARNGSNIHGAAANLTCDVSCRLELVYYTAGGGWTVRLGPPGPAGSTGASGTPDSASATVALTAQAYTTVAGDLRKTLLVTTGATDATITLYSASLAGDGKHISFRKADSGAGKVIVTDGSTAHAWLLSQGDVVRLRVNGTAWEVVDHKIETTVITYTANGTWTKPPLLKSLGVWAIGGGSGGGSGRRGAAGSARFGGGGGAASGINFLNVIPASSLAATETVTVAATAAGGAAVTVDDTSGNAGTSGNDSSFGTWIKGKAGGGGSGGTAAAGTGGTAATSTTMRVPIAGGSASSITATPTSVGTNVVGSGSAGGGLSSGNVEYAGGTPGSGSSASYTVVTAGAGGALGGSSGTAGSSIVNSLTQEGGSGGGGGGANAAGIGGSGAVGGSPGGGGGGGGASVNGSDSGAGAAGARGEIRVTQRF